MPPAAKAGCANAAAETVISNGTKRTKARIGSGLLNK
jgi:hypothetical protein